MGGVVVWLGFWALLGGAIGYAIGGAKGRGGTGFVLGFFLGFIGWIIVALMAPTAGAPQPRGSERIAFATDLATRTRPRHQRGPGPAPTSPSERACPWCAETIKVAARVCRFCGSNVEPTGPPPVFGDVALSPGDEVVVGMGGATAPAASSARVAESERLLEEMRRAIRQHPAAEQPALAIAVEAVAREARDHPATGWTFGWDEASARPFLVVLCTDRLLIIGTGRREPGTTFWFADQGGRDLRFERTTHELASLRLDALRLTRLGPPGATRQLLASGRHTPWLDTEVVDVDAPAD